VNSIVFCDACEEKIINWLPHLLIKVALVAFLGVLGDLGKPTIISRHSCGVSQVALGV